jgi:anti-anti-sigma regulatory factor
MLRITVITETERTVLKLEGKLGGPWVAELERCWRMAMHGCHNEPILIDLSDVSFVDSAGKELIRNMYGRGVELAVAGPLMTSIVSEIRAHSLRGQRPVMKEAS